VTQRRSSSGRARAPASRIREPCATITRTPRGRFVVLALFAVLCIAACERDSQMASAPETADAERAEGSVRVRYLAVAGADFSRDATPERQAWMRRHYHRAQARSPDFDANLAWFPDAWAYKDAYGVRPEEPLYSAHPEWLLRALDGALLFVPVGCREGTCPRYAADFGNPDFRAYWIEEARALLAKGYRGLWIDGVSLAWRVSDGNGRRVTPLDPRTGAPMKLAAWRRYLAEFVEQIRAELPDAEIVHNSVWHVEWTSDDSVQRQIDAADYVNLERGVNDRLLRDGSGRFSLARMLSFIDLVHARGRHFILMDYGETETQREYALAAWFLMQDGDDLLNSNRPAWTAPGRFWPGYTLDLGPALGGRSLQQKLLRREYACGLVLLNEPDRPARTVVLADTYTDLEGRRVDRVTIPAWTAKVLMQPCARMEGR
jgi:hypothetical protein